VKIKVDENLPTAAAAALVERGFDAHTVSQEGLAGTLDASLIEVARAEDRMVFTLDRGFGDIRSYPPGSHPGIIVFRLKEEAAPAAVAAVVSLIEHHDLEAFRGTVTVVGHDTLRVRRPD
jgi:predicted nuclease of predicted toxin-antitoxin system